MKVDFRKGDVVFCDFLGIELTVTGVNPVMAISGDKFVVRELDYNFEEVDFTIWQSDLRLVKRGEE